MMYCPQSVKLIVFNIEPGQPPPPPDIDDYVDDSGNFYVTRNDDNYIKR